MSEICVLEDGRRIRFSLKKRRRDISYYVSFRCPTGRVEWSTKEAKKKAAQESAIVLIRHSYSPTPVPAPTIQRISWDEAVTILLRYLKASGLRSKTIQQYELAVGAFRKLFPHTTGPADVTRAMAEEFKIKRVEAKRSPRTVDGNLGSLTTVFNRWKDNCKIVDSNPFEGVAPPKADKKPPRIIHDDERKAFFGWLSNRWSDWRLPILFLEVKSAIGCRVSELASITTENLKDGRIIFTCETTKGRRQRVCRPPVALYAELQAIAGPTYVFEHFPKQLKEVHKKLGHKNHAATVRDFHPARLVNWVQNEANAYFKTTKATYFKLHNFRGTAMSRARNAGVNESDAAIAFGCTPQTMREHYLTLDEERISDEVFRRMQAG